MKNQASVWFVYSDENHVSRVGKIKSNRLGSFGAISSLTKSADKNYIISTIGFSEKEMIIPVPKSVGFVGSDYGYASSTVGRYFIGDIG